MRAIYIVSLVLYGLFAGLFALVLVIDLVLLLAGEHVDYQGLLLLLVGFLIVPLVPVLLVYGVYIFQVLGQIVATRFLGEQIELVYLGPYKMIRIADGTLRSKFNLKKMDIFYSATYHTSNSGFDASTLKKMVVGGFLSALAFGLTLIAVYLYFIYYAVAANPDTDLGVGPFLFLFLFVAQLYGVGVATRKSLQGARISKQETLDSLSQAVRSEKAFLALDDDLQKAATELAYDQEFGMAATLLLYYLNMNESDTETAKDRVKYLRNDLERIAVSLRPEYEAEIAYALAVLENEPETARAYYERCRKGLKWFRSYALLNRVEAALAYAEGRMDDTETLVKKGLADLEGKTGSVSANQLPAQTARNLLRKIPV